MAGEDDIDPGTVRRKLVLKHAFDRILAFALLAVLWPLILLLAAAIRLEGLFRREWAGPAFHHETRVSAGREFHIWKFRTAPPWVIDWINERPEVRSISKVKKHRTAVGRFILNWYLDELPQLWNILRGDMSFVGPRPQPTLPYEMRLQSGVRALEILRGGLLGIPQACKTNDAYVEYFDELAGDYTDRTVYHERMDELYLRKILDSSPAGVLAFDLRVLAMGIRTVVVGGGGAADTVIAGDEKTNPWPDEPPDGDVERET